MELLWVPPVEYYIKKVIMPFQRPIMEDRVMDSFAKLSDDKTGFRDGSSKMDWYKCSNAKISHP